jgi:hypothetical protein
MDNKNIIDAAISILKKQIEDLEQQNHILETTATNRKSNAFFKKGTKKLAEFFFSKGYLIISLDTNVSEHYKLGKLIFNLRPLSWDFNSQLLLKHEPFSFDTSELSDHQKNDLRNLCLEMQKRNFIKFSQEETSIQVEPFMTGENRYYLAGECYEEANRYLIEKTIREFSQKCSEPLSFKVYRNIKLKKSNSESEKLNDMQLDFVVEFPDRFYIFETKAGQKLYIDKWVDRTRLFGDDLNKYITCCLQDFNPYTFDPFLLLPMKTLDTDFMNLLEQEFGQK